LSAPSASTRWSRARVLRRRARCGALRPVTSTRLKWPSSRWRTQSPTAWRLCGLRQWRPLMLPARMTKPRALRWQRPPATCAVAIWSTPQATVPRTSRIWPAPRSSRWSGARETLWFWTRNRARWCRSTRCRRRYRRASSSRVPCMATPWLPRPPPCASQATRRPMRTTSTRCWTVRASWCPTWIRAAWCAHLPAGVRSFRVRTTSLLDSRPWCRGCSRRRAFSRRAWRARRPLPSAWSRCCATPAWPCVNVPIGTRSATRRMTLTARRSHARKSSLSPIPRGGRSSAAARRCPRPRLWPRFGAARAQFRSRASSAAAAPAWVGARVAFARAAWLRSWRASWAATPARCC
jgi:glycerol3P_GlpA: glycerol-3-phosphate dehydrogenase, anaerobic, A subunit